MPRSDLVQSLLRGMDILQLVAYSEYGLTLRELCDAMGLKQPTAYNLIRTLAARGFLEKTPRPVRYRLGASLGELAGAHHKHALVRRASEVMRGLFDHVRRAMGAQVGEYEDAAVTFARFGGGRATMALRLRLTGPGGMERPDYHFDPYCSAAALVLQAYLSKPELELYWRRHSFPELGAYAWGDLDRLNKYLADVRRTGYAAPPIYPKEVLRAAAPVFGRGRVVTGALGMGIWHKLTRPQRDAFTKKLVAAAGELSEEPAAAAPAGGKAGSTRQCLGG